MSTYSSENWQLLIDSSKASLEIVLLNNENRFAPVPIGYSTNKKEEYLAIKVVLKKLYYNVNRWIICVDLKWSIFFLASKVGTLSTNISCAFVIAEQETSTMIKNVPEFK